MKHLILISFLFFLTHVFGQSNQHERVLDFDVLIEVDTQGVYDITEKITVAASGNRIKRGIYRALPTRRKEKTNSFVNISYTIESILKDGKRETYHTKEEGGYFKIYVGHKDIYLSNGVYEYTVKYKTYGHVGFFDNYDEVYWNVTGTEWTLPIDKVKAKIRIQGNPEVKQMACYVGSYGSSDSNCSKESKPEIRFTAENLQSRQGLTVAVGFEKGAVQPPPPPTFFQKFKGYILLIGATLLLLIYYLGTWMKFGKDPEKPAVYPIYEPPENMSPAYLASIYHDKVSEKYFPASIINLAVKGKINIKESKKGKWSGNQYTFTKTGKTDSNLAPEELAILRSFGGNSIKLNGKYSSKVAKMQNNYYSALKSEARELIEKGRNCGFLILPVLIIAVISLLVFLTSNSQGSFNAYNALSDVLFGAVFGLMFLGPTFFSLFKNFKYKYYGLAGLIIILAGAFIYFKKNSMVNIQISIISFVVFGIVSLLIYRYLIEKPSKEKLRQKSLVEGFKMYLSAAEVNQIEQFNPPEMTPELFEKYLPYAIALNVGDIWGEKFASYLKTAGISNYNHGWYAGNHSFSSDMYRTMNRSVNNTLNQSATKPSSSGGGSYSSGSGGGGFSGGGGGGGGGGGW